MKSKNHQAEHASSVAQNKPQSEFRVIDSRIFEPNFDGSRTIIGVPRDFLYPRVLPPVGPQVPMEYENTKK